MLTYVADPMCDFKNTTQTSQRFGVIVVGEFDVVSVLQDDSRRSLPQWAAAPYSMMVAKLG